MLKKLSTSDKALFGYLAKAYLLSVDSKLAGQYPFKRTVARDFRLLIFFMNQFPPSPWPLGPFQFVLKIWGDICSSRCTTGVNDTGGKWKKSSIIKVLIILFGHLWEEELTYRYIFAYKFTLRSQQPDIVPIICRRCHWRQWCTLRIFPRIFEKIRNSSNGILWGWRKLIHEKNQKQKISWHCPFNIPGCFSKVLVTCVCLERLSLLLPPHLLNIIFFIYIFIYPESIQWSVGNL